MSNHLGSADVPLSDLPLTGRQQAAFTEAGILTLENLLLRFPRRFEDRSTPAALPEHPSGAPVLVFGTIVLASPRRFGRQRCTVLELRIAPSGNSAWESLTCRWFGMPYLARGFSAGAEIFVFGTAKVLKGELFMDHPEHEVIREGDPLQLGTCVPVHTSPRGITTRDYRRLVRHACDRLETLLPDLLPPPKPDGPFAGSCRLDALRNIHFPPHQQALDAAKRYLALEWLVGQQLGITARRARADSLPKIRPATATPALKKNLLTELLKSLPFQATTDQKKAIEEIQTDLVSSRPMNRLLHGDVGSGKTLVAAAAAAITLNRGDQVALMAPTQILAEQHYSTLTRWFHPLGIAVSLITSSLRQGHPATNGLVIGTHALLHSKDDGLAPALVIIDEQHKFGVAQREKLIGHAPESSADVLILTATPIPRTLVITTYGDLDVSTLKEKPAGRARVTTAARYGYRVRELTAFLKRELTMGRQAYLVFPRIDDSSSGKIPTLEDEFPKWKKRLGAYQVGSLHGGVSLEDRESTMEAFRNGEIAVLLCTTVIEVGVDVPNATVMCVFGAGRFGLAQLHQLRGRIGRGSKKSYCLLLPDRDDPEIREKLALLEASNDGFQIAEADLARRGPGDILGFAQSGHSGFAALSEHLLDAEFCDLARKLALKISGNDPELRTPANRALIRLSSPQRLGDGSLQ